jgi:hypothetical protein
LTDLSNRTPGFWIGLAAAVLVLVACLGALALVAVLAGLRGGLVGVPATPGPDRSLEATALQTPARPVGKANAPPSVNNKWPSEDVPMPAGADLGTLIGSSEAFSVFTDQDFAGVLGFYQEQMEALGWTKVSYGTRITENDAELHYQNNLYHITVILASIPFVGTLVEIHLSPL